MHGKGPITKKNKKIKNCKSTQDDTDFEDKDFKETINI